MLILAMLLAGTGCRNRPKLLTAHGKPVMHWLAQLKQPDPGARKQAVKVLGGIGKADPAVIPGLIEALQDADPGVRSEAVLALLRIGPDAREAIPALTAAQTDRDATVACGAGKALARIRGGN
jgi:HEAT repeat protein